MACALQDSKYMQLMLLDCIIPALVTDPAFCCLVPCRTPSTLSKHCSRRTTLSCACQQRRSCLHPHSNTTGQPQPWRACLVMAAAVKCLSHLQAALTKAHPSLVLRTVLQTAVTGSARRCCWYQYVATLQCVLMWRLIATLNESVRECVTEPNLCVPFGQLG